MMWHVQLFIDCAGAMLAQDMVLNGAFACLALWGGFGRSPRTCAVLTALVYLFLMVS